MAAIGIVCGLHDGNLRTIVGAIGTFLGLAAIGVAVGKVIEFFEYL